MTCFEWVCSWSVCLAGAGAIAYVWDWIGERI